MPHRLLFADAETAADLVLFAGRAASLSDGAVRLRAEAGTLVATGAALAPRGLFDSTPTVLGLRAMPVDPELVTDVVVTAAELTADPADPRAVVLPESAVTASWAGISPPRSGWEDTGTVDAATLAARAQWGIASVAEGMPRDPGEDAVRALRAAVWSPPDDDIAGLPLGVAFAAFAFGFIGGEEHAMIRTAGPWTRLSLARGHVLLRGPVRSGLTPVRSTGG